MKNVLIVSGHPRINNDSVANKAILEELAATLPEAVINRLDELYPDYTIDVEAEQAKLVAADIVVLQFPLWWFHFPSLMQKWMEDVFLHGFSHGTTGKALQGKKLLVSVTTGAPEAAYDPDEGFGIEDYMNAIKAMCGMTGMSYEGCLCLYGVSYLSRTEPGAIAEMTERSKEFARELTAKVEKL